MQVFANNVTVFVNQLASSVATEIALDSVASLPIITGDQFFTITFFKTDNKGVESDWEVVKVTAINGNKITCVRGFDGTMAREWLPGAVGQMRVSRAILADLTTKAGGAVQAAALAASDGAGLVGTGSGDTVEAAINAQQLADYTALRAYTGKQKAVYITGSGISGQFNVDDADTTSLDNAITIIVAANGKRWKRGYSGKISVRWSGAKGDDIADDTSAINVWKAACAGKSGIMPNGTYKYTEPMVLSGFDVDFDGSILHYAGPPSTGFALTLNSDAGGGSLQTSGNTFSGNLTLYQNNFAEFVTVTGSAAYDPPSIAGGSTITSITPGGVSTTVAVPGATVGGFARATFTSAVEGVEVTARVTSPDVVTVTFSNYGNAAVDMASGTINVTVANNAYHGLCLGGVLGRMQNAKVLGFTGVSVALGDGIDPASGVALSGSSRCYYWKADLNVAAAAGWGFVIPGRNNENEISYSTFPFNAYNDSIPRRANFINQLVVQGLTNTFPKMSLEGSASEETVLLMPGANGNQISGIGYIEYNTNHVVPSFPRIRAKTFSSANIMRFRHPYTGKAIADAGTANDLQVVMSNYVNGNQFAQPGMSRNMVVNGDFENGTNNWSNFSAGSTLTVTGSGVFSGKRARLDLVSGRPNLQQDMQTTSGINLSGLMGQNVTVGAWIKTNIPAVKPRIAGVTGNTGTIGDGTDEFITVTFKVPQGATTLPLSITTDASNLTGYVEVSNVTCVVGLTPLAFGERTQPMGSVAYNPASIATGAEASTAVTVAGAALGDFAVASFSLDTQGIKLNARVSAADTVTVTFRNDTGGALDIANGTILARVIKA